MSELEVKPPGGTVKSFLSDAVGTVSQHMLEDVVAMQWAGKKSKGE